MLRLFLLRCCSNFDYYLLSLHLNRHPFSIYPTSPLQPSTQLTPLSHLPQPPNLPKLHLRHPPHNHPSIRHPPPNTPLTHPQKRPSPRPLRPELHRHPRHNMGNPLCRRHRLTRKPSLHRPRTSPPSPRLRRQVPLHPETPPSHRPRSCA